MKFDRYVRVTMLSQIDLGGQDNLNTKVYSGLSKQPSIAALKVNIVRFYDSWVSYLDSTMPNQEKNNKKHTQLDKSNLSSLMRE